jgi:alpha-1,3-rhamnosyl/mannosyltransferase
LDGAAAIVADSKSTASDLEAFCGVAPGRVTVIYPGVDERYFVPVGNQDIEAARRKYGIDDGPYVLCLGPWVKRKNIGVVVAAFSLLVERLPDVRLVITGRRATGMKGFDLPEALERMPERVRSKVVAVGHLPGEELRAVLQGASVLAYPSLVEGFGLPPLEAMAAGVPVVASDAPAVVEAAGEAALIARASEPGEWAEALYQVLTDKGKAAKLRVAGKRRSELFMWERCAEETVDLYDRIVKKSEVRSQKSDFASDD